MDLLTVMRRFPTQEACIAYLEHVRWGDDPCCPYCGSRTVSPKQERNRVGRWNCHGCHSSFNVLAGTIFSATRIPLPKWFLAIALLVNAKKSLSSHQLARDLGMTQQTAWYLAQRVRKAMANEQDKLFLRGLLEADETYVGGEPRKPNKRNNPNRHKRGRGTSKRPVMGVVERGGRLFMQAVPDTSGESVRSLIDGRVEPSGSLLITDEWQAYRVVRQWMDHEVIKHKELYCDGDVHTNHIEGAWSLLKRAFHGQHHHYSAKWTPHYLAEAGWKYNQRYRQPRESFHGFFAGCFSAAARRNDEHDRASAGF